MSPPPRCPPSRRFPCGLLALAVPLLAACYDDVQAPKCRTLADCPAGQGYTACEDGYCFKSGRCDGALPVAGDGCCAVVEGDRSADTDCLVADHDLECRDPAGPVADADGGVFVACRTVDAGGASTLVLRRVDPAGRLEEAVEVGSAATVLAPTVSRGVHVYVAHSGGVVRRDALTGVQIDAIPSDTPVGGIATSGRRDLDFGVAGWPTVSGKVVLFDEKSRTASVFTAAPVTAGEDDAFPPVVSAGGLRLYVLWRDGTLHAVRIGANPSGPVAVAMLPARPAAPPVEVDGRVFVAMEDGRLAAMTEKGATFTTEWTTPLDGKVAGGLLADASGAVVAVLESGEVAVVRDLFDRGSLVGRGDLGMAAGTAYPFLGAAPRVAAIASDGRKVASLLRTDAAGAVAFTEGLSFTVPVAIAGTPLLAGRNLWMATQSGHLVAWQFPDDLAGRFARGGSDVYGTGQTAQATAGETE